MKKESQNEDNKVKEKEYQINSFIPDLLKADIRLCHFSLQAKQTQSSREIVGFWQQLKYRFIIYIWIQQRRRRRKLKAIE